MKTPKKLNIERLRKDICDVVAETLDSLGTLHCTATVKRSDVDFVEWDFLVSNQSGLE